MKQYEEVFFSILRGSLLGTPVHVPEGFSDWKSVMKLAQTQALNGLVGDVLLTRTEIRDTLPAKFIEKLQEIPLNNMGMHTILNNTLILVVSRLRECGVEPVLLKGQGLARYYPVPELRQCGDIDLYVGQENYERAYEALKSIVTEIDDKAALNVGKHFHAKVGSVILEIHRFADRAESDRQNETFQKYASAGLNHNLVTVDFSGLSVNTPANDFNAYFIFNHLWHHFVTEGVGLRQLCDWMMFLHSQHKKFSVDYVERIVKDMHLVKPWKTFGCILVDALGLPADEMPLYDPKFRRKSNRVLARVLAEGNFGKQTAYVRVHRRSYVYEKLFSLKCHISRYFSLFFLFPRPAVRWFLYILKSGFRQVFKDLKLKRK